MADGSEDPAAFRARLLRTFVSDQRGREYLHKPFARAGHTYASDGTVCVRVPSAEGDAVIQAAPSAEKLFAEHTFDPVAFVTPPAWTAPPRSSTKCDYCDGRGRAHDCPDCECVCDECDGAGYEDDDHKRSIGVMGLVLSVRTARRVWLLPGLKLGPPPPTPFHRWPFIFDGGEGLMMPRREPAAEHNDSPNEEVAPSHNAGEGNG